MPTNREWWEIGSIVGSALATITLAVFAGVQIWREKQRQADQAKTASVRLSGVGYLLRIRLLRWIGTDPRDEINSAFDRWLRRAGSSDMITGELEGGRSEVREMIALAATAPKGSAAAARSIYVNFLEGVRRVEEHVSTTKPSDPTEFMNWVHLRADAVADFRACIEDLEGAVIEPFLLNSERSMRRKREEEEPFGQLAREIGKMMDAEEQRSDPG